MLQNGIVHFNNGSNYNSLAIKDMYLTFKNMKINTFNDDFTKFSNDIYKFIFCRVDISN